MCFSPGLDAQRTSGAKGRSSDFGIEELSLTRSSNLPPFPDSLLLPLLKRISQSVPNCVLDSLQVRLAIHRLWFIEVFFQHFYKQIAMWKPHARQILYGFTALPGPVFGVAIRHRECDTASVMYWRDAVKMAERFSGNWKASPIQRFSVLPLLPLLALVTVSAHVKTLKGEGRQKGMKKDRL